jgi:hypothetical protein
MLVACRLAGSSRLGRTMQASARPRNRVRAGRGPWPSWVASCRRTGLSEAEHGSRRTQPCKSQVAGLAA